MKHLGSLESTQEARGIFRALQTSRVLHISMNARWHMNQLLIDIVMITWTLPQTNTRTTHKRHHQHHKRHDCFSSHWYHLYLTQIYWCFVYWNSLCVHFVLPINSSGSSPPWSEVFLLTLHDFGDLYYSCFWLRLCILICYVWKGAMIY